MIRRATAEDAAAIAAIHVRAWRHAYADILDPQLLAELDVTEHTEQWRESLDGNRAIVWVFEQGDRVAGFASARATLLATLYVDPVAQGAGVGTALLAEAEAAGAAELEVFAANGHGRRFYEARGWRDDGDGGEWLGQPLRRYVR